MAYADELVNDQYKGNVVIRINGGAYYARHQPDSGLTVAASNRILDKFGINPQVISLEDAKTTFGSVTFTLVDLGGVITSLFNNNMTLFMGQEVEIWLGRITGSLAFSDYLKLQKFRISRVTFKNEEYSFTAQEITADFKKAVFNTKALLNADTSAGAGSLVMATDIAAFPSSGKLFLEDELIAYSSKNDGTKTFTLTGTLANDHGEGTEVLNVTTITNQNPLDILLRILQSTGGGTYDSYAEGLGVVDADLDIAGIEAIRDANFAGELFSFELFGIENALEFMEAEILKPCSLRFVPSSGNKLSLTVLDTSIFGAATKTLDADNIDHKSIQYEVNTESVKNTIIIEYGYDYATGKYSRTHSETDAESVTNYGAKDPFIIQSKGIPATSGGDAIATDRALRWLARLSTATPSISVSTFFNTSLALIGERVLLTYDLPTETGDRLFSKELEIIKKSIDENKGIVKFDLAFTNYSGLRECFISPTSPVNGYNDAQALFFVDEAELVKWKVGYLLRVRRADGTDHGPYKIESMMANGAFSRIDCEGAGPVEVASGWRLKYADYDDTVGGDSMHVDQRRYGYVSDGAGNFADGSRPYQITF